MSCRLISSLTSLIAVALATTTCARADFADGVADSLGFVIGGYTLFASQGDRQARAEAKELTNALFATAGVSQGLKELISSDRPDGSGDDGFPSMHVSLTAAWAEVASRNHPRQRWMHDAYLGAMMWARVDQDKHKERDVLAGALLGAAIGKHYSPRHRGFVLGKMSW